MRDRIKRIGKWVGLGLLVLVLGVGLYVGGVAYAYGRSVDHVYDVPLPDIERSTDPEVLARGEHLARSLGGCALSDCHSADLGGGQTADLGPIGSMTAPNITAGGRGAQYSDAELARLIQHGVKRDGRTVRFMPAHETAWLPDEDVRALVTYVRSVPSVSRPSGPMEIGLLGRILDRHDMIPIDIARRIDHAERSAPPAPAPTAAYGAYIGRMCTGCHGEHLSGGPIPGAPPDMAVPLNITPHAEGLGDWTYEDFETVMRTARRRDGRALDPMMPTEAVTNMDDTERRALWEYLRSVPPTPSGQR
ncbi:MAG: c-type cytochrome [Sandaracinaceae bacterium]|nr:c-type cytochrome [Sandaracinaceae bacterium]